MTKLKIKNLNKFEQSLKTDIKKALNDPFYTKAIAEIIVEDIQDTQYAASSELQKARKTIDELSERVSNLENS